MINWIGVLKAALSLADWVAKICHDKQLLDAGQYKAIAKYNENANKKIADAIAARRNARSMRDPNDAANDY